MIDNTVVIVESLRAGLQIASVIVAMDNTDNFNFDYESLSCIKLANLTKAGEYVSAWDSSPELFQYNRIYFLDKEGQVENIMKIKPKTQREITVDLRIRECNLYTISDNLLDCS